GINDAGRMVGNYRDADNRWHGFLLDADGSYTTIDVLPRAYWTYANGINDSGQIVGSYGEKGCFLFECAFLRDVDGSYTDISRFRASDARGLNDGCQSGGRFGATGFLRDVDGRYTTIDVPSEQYSYASGINNAGQIVGSYWNDRGPRHGFLATPR